MLMRMYMSRPYVAPLRGHLIYVTSVSIPAMSERAPPFFGVQSHCVLYGSCRTRCSLAGV